MIDFLLFLATLTGCMTAFAGLQTLGLRLQRPRRLLLYLLFVYFATAIATIVLSFVIARPYFSSASCYAVALGGTLLTSFFAAGLYSFLGPATADRSCTAHFLMLLRECPNATAESEQLIERFDGRVFMEKRFAECCNANLIQLDGATVRLTSKGMRMANLYAVQLHGFHLHRRAEFENSFTEESTTSCESGGDQDCAKMVTCG